MNSLAGLVVGTIAASTGGGVTIIAEGWLQVALFVLSVGAAFGLGTWNADNRISALLALVRSFCEEIVAYRVARTDGEITDAEAQEIAGRVGRFVTDLEALALVLCKPKDPPP